MLQQLIWMLAAAASPVTPCPQVNHVPAPDVAHVPDADVEPWLDPATAELVAEPKPRIERRIGDQGVKVDVEIPKALTEVKPDCR